MGHKQMVCGRPNVASMAFGRPTPCKIRHDGRARFDLGGWFGKAGDWIKNKALPWVDRAVSDVANVLDPNLGKAYDTLAEGIRQKRPAEDIVGDIAGQIPNVLGGVTGRAFKRLRQR